MPSPFIPRRNHIKFVNSINVLVNERECCTIFLPSILPLRCRPVVAKISDINLLLRQIRGFSSAELQTPHNRSTLRFCPKRKPITPPQKYRGSWHQNFAMLTLSTLNGDQVLYVIYQPNSLSCNASRSNPLTEKHLWRQVSPFLRRHVLVVLHRRRIKSKQRIYTDTAGCTVSTGAMRARVRNISTCNYHVSVHVCMRNVLFDTIPIEKMLTINGDGISVLQGPGLPLRCAE